MITPQDIVERTLAASTSRGCIVLVQARSIANLRWARSTLTTNGETLSTSVTVIALVDVAGGVAAGSVTVSAPSPESLPELVARAEALAIEDGPAEDAAELVRDLEASPDWSEAPAVETAESFSTIAPGLGEVLEAGRADGVEHFGYAEQSMLTNYLGTSTGVRLRFTDSEGRIEFTGKSHDRARSAWVGRAGRTLHGVDLPSLDAEVRRSLAWQERTIDVEPGRHRALLTPSAVSDLMIDLYWSSAGLIAHEGQSVWSRRGGGTRVGEQVADPRVTLWSDPSWAGQEAQPFLVASSSSPYASVFDNGLPVPATRWIDSGVLGALITSRHTAAVTGLDFRPAADNLRLDVEGASGSLDDVVARTDDGLLVTCTWYNRTVDAQTGLLTGLTRDGVYVVRGGEVVGSATNFRFNESPLALLSRIRDAGTPVPTLAREMGDYFNRAVMPPLLVDDFNFSTVSQAS
ncbi:MAG: metallopeptidase TldD-related protein [Candidatus Nanopelagicales bacterium]